MALIARIHPLGMITTGLSERQRLFPSHIFWTTSSIDHASTAPFSFPRAAIRAKPSIVVSFSQVDRTNQCHPLKIQNVTVHCSRSSVFFLRVRRRRRTISPRLRPPAGQLAFVFQSAPCARCVRQRECSLGHAGKPHDQGT